MPPAKTEETRTEAEEIARLGAASWEERASAAVGLSHVGGPDAGQAVTAALDDEDEFVRAAAARALAQVGGPDTAERLIAALKDDAWPMRLSAANSLGWLREATAVEPLIELLEDEHSQVRVAAAVALAEIGPAAVDPLSRVLGTFRFLSRRRGESQFIADPVLGSFSSTSVSDLAMTILVHIGEPAIEPLEARLCDASADATHDIARTLMKLGSPRYRWARWLENYRDTQPLGGRRDVGALIETLRAEDSELQVAAARALGQLGDREAIGPLLTALSDEDMEVQEAAAEALGKLRAKQAVVPLVTILNREQGSQDWYRLRDLREASIEALGLIGDRTALVAIVRKLPELESDQRTVAIRTIFRLGGEDAAGVLVDCLLDWGTGPDAALALERLRWIPTTESDRIHYLVARRQRQALLDRWPTTRAVLMQDVIGDSTRAMHNALYALIGCGKDEVLAELAQTLNERGNREMAEVFLNCGQRKLSAAARRWAHERGYTINTGAGASPVGWGNM
ncbi:MAG: HEAT repeat domain-containing protein [Phycisphaerae bacterium]|jgi:HEAT repeat protein